MKAVRILGVIAVLAAVLGGAVYLLREEILDQWLRRELAGELSQRLDAEVEMKGVHYRDGVLRVEFCRVGGDAMPFNSLEIRDASVPLDWQRLRNLAGTPVAIEAASMNLVWRDTPSSRRSAKPNGASGGANQETEVDILVAKFSFRHEDAERWQVKDTAARGAFASGRWSLSARGGVLTARGWPELPIERVSAEQTHEGWNIASFALQGPDKGAVGGSANWRDGQWSGEFSWHDIALQGLLPAGADEYFSGRGSGDARLAGGALEGRMKIEGAEVRNLPALVKLASIFNGEDYRSLPWQSLSFNFRRDAAGVLGFDGLTAVSPKGVAVQGSGKIAGENLAANLQLGVQREGRPWLVAFIPVLFRSEKNGYLWTPVKVGGTLQSPTEDLTARVVAALAVVPATEAAETAVEVPATAVEAAGGLLRSLLGH